MVYRTGLRGPRQPGDHPPKALLAPGRAGPGRAGFPRRAPEAPREGKCRPGPHPMRACGWNTRACVRRASSQVSVSGWS